MASCRSLDIDPGQFQLCEADSPGNGLSQANVIGWGLHQLHPGSGNPSAGADLTGAAAVCSSRCPTPQIAAVQPTVLEIS